MIIKTDGRGIWSRVSRDVELTSMYIGYVNEDNEFGELRVKFTKKSWNINKHGLIYTDDTWLKGLRNHLLSLGFSKVAVKDVDYPEQGMQGTDYVSLDVGKKFLSNWNKKYNNISLLTNSIG